MGRISPHTWILDLSSRYNDLVQLYFVSYISDRLISELQHLASYVSRHNAMAYDSVERTIQFDGFPDTR
jgi:hypothetical protein